MTITNCVFYSNMKILFPGPGEQLVCEACGRPLIDEPEAAEADLCEYRWCERCMDFVRGLVVPIAPPTRWERLKGLLKKHFLDPCSGPQTW